MTEPQAHAVAAALERVFRRYNDKVGPRDKDQRTHDFVFHMTDWYADLRRLAALYAEPTKHEQSEWNQVVAGFLYHAVGHLLAAAKLNDTLLDPFHVLSKKALQQQTVPPASRRQSKKPKTRRPAASAVSR